MASIDIRPGMSPQALLALFEGKKLTPLKDNFRIDFNAKNEEERKAHREGKISCVMMTPDKVHKVLQLLEKCGNGFHVRALEQIVLEQYEIPDNFKEVEERANQIMNEAMKTS